MAATNTPNTAVSKAVTKQQLSTNNYIIVLILISLLVLGVAVLISKTLVGSISRDGKIWSAKNTANKQLDTDLQNAPQLIQSFNNLPTGAEGLIAHSLPTTSDFPGLISLLEVAGSSVGVTVTSVTPSQLAVSTTTPKADTAAGAQPVSVDIQVHGSYANLMSFFHNLEISSRPMRVSTVQFTGTGTDLSASMNLTTYYQAKATLPFSMRTIK